MPPGNGVPPFVQLNGPVREVRFATKPNASPDGGVHAIFTISGRPDAPAGCSIAQPNLANTSNMVSRFPTPVFGAGLNESITDNTIRIRLVSNAARKLQLGISGRVNTSGNDGAVTGFG